MKTFKATVTFVDSDRIWSELIATKSQAVAIRAARRLAMQAVPYRSILQITVVDSAK